MPWPTGQTAEHPAEQHNDSVKQGMPLRRRLVISSLLGTIPLTLLGMILLCGRYFTLRDVMLDSNLSQARLAAAYTEGWFDGQISTLRTIAQSNEIQHGTLDDIRGLATRQVHAQQSWDSLWVTDAVGNELIDTAGGVTFVGDREYFRQAKATGTPCISDLLIDRINGHRIIAVAYPIMRHGKFDGIVAAGIRPALIQRVFAQVPVGENSIIALWGSDRQLIARTDTPQVMLGERYIFPEDAVIALTGKSGKSVATSPITGKRVLIGYAPVTIARWTVVTSVPISAAVATLTRAMLVFLVVASMVVTVTLLWTFYSSNVIAGQVAVLANAAREIGEGNLAIRVKLNMGGELADLAHSLNKMAADLQLLDRLKSDLLSMVSHELKTPLTSIRASLDVIINGVVSPEHPRYHELLEIAERQSRRLQDMIENLLSVARMETGGLGVSPRTTRLSPILDTSMQQYEELARARNLSVIISAPYDLYVCADTAKLTLALNNLLDNAVKFTEQGSILIRVHANNDKAVVTVTDTGTGLTPEVRTRLFERFYQGEPLLTRKSGGAGLGLFVTKAIIEAHGGRVFAESEGEGHGSTFGFTVPLVPSQEHE